jgi:uncharacterized protein YjiS (DUF1127 family)
MTALPTTDPFARLTEIASVQGLPPLSRLAVAMARGVVAWETRHRARRSLARLDAHLLRDIGISERDATAEVAKPFWRA